MKKNLDKTKPRYSVQILTVPWPFVQLKNRHRALATGHFLSNI